MVWQIAVIIDPEYNCGAASSLASNMPIWIVDSPENQVCITAVRRDTGDMWLPEAVCTSFTVQNVDDRLHNCLCLINTLDEHYPLLAKLNLAGLEDSELLRSQMLEFGFLPAIPTWDETVAFRRPILTLKNVPHFHLEASKWKTSDDIYESLFDLLGAPAWHGKNFNALKDSIETGDINKVEVPYILSVHNPKSLDAKVKALLLELTNFIAELEARGCPISIRIED